MDHQMTQDEETGSSLHLAPSPQSEAVAHDFQELSLQSVQQLPPLKERKNVDDVKTRWRSMRNNFKRELERQRQENRRGSAASRRTQYFQQLLFLKPIMLLCRTESNLDPCTHQGAEERDAPPPRDISTLEDETLPNEDDVALSTNIPLEPSPTQPSLSFPSPSLASSTHSSPSRDSGHRRGQRGRSCGTEHNYRKCQRQSTDDLEEALNLFMEDSGQERGANHHFALSLVNMIDDVPKERLPASKVDMIRLLSTYAKALPRPYMSLLEMSQNYPQNYPQYSTYNNPPPTAHPYYQRPCEQHPDWSREGFQHVQAAANSAFYQSPRQPPPPPHYTTFDAAPVPEGNRDAESSPYFHNL